MDKTHSKKRVALYFVAHIIVSIIMIAWYFWNYYTPLNGFTEKWNYLAFFVVYSLMFLGFFGSLKDDVGAAFILLDVLIPIELYAIIARESYVDGLEKIIFVVVISAVICVVVSSFIKYGFNEKQAQYAFILITVAVIPMAVMTVFLKGPDTSSSTNLKDFDVFSHNLQSLILFDDEKWTELNNKEKQNAIVTAIEVEKNELGFPYDIEFQITDLNSENNDEDREEHAVYQWDSQTILLDQQYFSTANGYDIYKTMVHECYHAYEYGLIQMLQYVPKKYRNLKLLDMVRYYEVELNNYDDGEDTFMTYYYQQLEYQARKYAEERTEQLKQKIP